MMASTHDINISPAKKWIDTKPTTKDDESSTEDPTESQSSDEVNPDSMTQEDNGGSSSKMIAIDPVDIMTDTLQLVFDAPIADDATPVLSNRNLFPDYDSSLLSSGVDDSMSSINTSILNILGEIKSSNARAKDNGDESQYDESGNDDGNDDDDSTYQHSDPPSLIKDIEQGSTTDESASSQNSPHFVVGDNIAPDPIEVQKTVKSITRSYSRSSSSRIRKQLGICLCCILITGALLTTGILTFVVKGKLSTGMMGSADSRLDSRAPPEVDAPLEDKDGEAETSIPVHTTTIPTRAPAITITAGPTNVPITSTSAPTVDGIDMLQTRLAPYVLDPTLFDNIQTSYYATLEWLATTDTITRTIIEEDDIDDAHLRQRFGVALLATALGAPLDPDTNECSWTGITCGGHNETDANAVTDLAWPDQRLAGRIPKDVAILSGLRTLDLGENQVRGAIPDAVFDLVHLKALYLQSNDLSGGLSKRVGQLRDLEYLFLGDNDLTGSVPKELGSPGLGSETVRPLKSISLYNNKFSGSLPLEWNLRELDYLDMGRNNLSGFIPTDWYQGRNTMWSLRSLYLDHNRFSGELLEDFSLLGNNRLYQLVINDNQFTGEMVGGFGVRSLVLMDFHNNNFSSMNKNVCKNYVFVGGEMVSLRADCAVCDCKTLCDEGKCYNSIDEE